MVPAGAQAPSTEQALGPEGVVLSPGASAALPVHQKCLVSHQIPHSMLPPATTEFENVRLVVIKRSETVP